MKPLLAILLGGMMVFMLGCSSADSGSEKSEYTERTIKTAEVEVAQPYSNGPTELPVVSPPTELPPSL
jgi:hypothetical protein